jgi:hypothetical protein
MLGSTAMPVRLLRVHKSLKPQRWTPSTTAFIPSSGLASSEDRFLAVYIFFSGLLLLFRFTWLVPRAPIPFIIGCRDVL